MRRHLTLLAGLGFLSLLALPPAGAVTITFDEVVLGQFPGPVDGQTYLNVTFDYKKSGLDSNAAVFGDTGPGTLTHIADPSLIGDAEGILTLDFTVPVVFLAFAVALDSTTPYSPAVTGSLDESALNPIGGGYPVDTSLLGSIQTPEGLFSYSGVGVARAVLDFEDEGTHFVLDNLAYETLETPEPASLLLLGGGLTGLALLRRRRR